MEPAADSGARPFLRSAIASSEFQPQPATIAMRLPQADWRVLDGAILVHSAEHLEDEERRDSAGG